MAEIFIPFAAIEALVMVLVAVEMGDARLPAPADAPGSSAL